MLAEMGVKVKYNTPSECEFQADDVNLDYIRTEEYRRKAESLRGSVMVLGPMVARFGSCRTSKTGRRQDRSSASRHPFHRVA